MQYSTPSTVITPKKESLGTDHFIFGEGPGREVGSQFFYSRGARAANFFLRINLSTIFSFFHGSSHNYFFHRNKHEYKEKKNKSELTFFS